MVLLPDLSWHSWLVLLRVSDSDLVALEDVAAYLDEFLPFCEQGIYLLEPVGILCFARCGCLHGGINFAKTFLVVVRLDLVSWRIKGLVTYFAVMQVLFN